MPPAFLNFQNLQLTRRLPHSHTKVLKLASPTGAVRRDVLHYDAGRIETLERAGVLGPAAGKGAPSGQ